MAAFCTKGTSMMNCYGWRSKLDKPKSCTPFCAKQKPPFCLSRAKKETKNEKRFITSTNFKWKISEYGWQPGIGTATNWTVASLSLGSWQLVTMRLIFLGKEVHTKLQPYRRSIWFHLLHWFVTKSFWDLLAQWASHESRRSASIPHKRRSGDALETMLWRAAERSLNILHPKGHKFIRKCVLNKTDPSICCFKDRKKSKTRERQDYLLGPSASLRLQTLGQRRQCGLLPELNGVRDRESLSFQTSQAAHGKLKVSHK